VHQCRIIAAPGMKKPATLVTWPVSSSCLPGNPAI
jgi:hypothetical protein